MNNTHQKLHEIDKAIAAYEKQINQLQTIIVWHEKEILKHKRQRMEIIIQTNTAYSMFPTFKCAEHCNLCNIEATRDKGNK